MNTTPIVDIIQNRLLIGKEVIICGWVRNRRDSKLGISFLTIYDGSCFDSIQTIIKNSLPNYKKDILHLTTGCSVIICGKVVNSPGKKQEFEIQVSSVKVVGWVEDPNTYPIAAKYHSTEHLREVSHLRARTNLIGAVSRVRHTLIQALHGFFDNRGYFLVSTPLITSLNTEGIGEMFRVSTLDIKNLSPNLKDKINYKKDFFGKESFLTVSSQLYGESYACALSKIYTFGPVFRAENSNTSRHLSEFWMLEPEVAFASLDDIIHLAEDMLKYVFKEVLKNRLDDMKYFSKNINKNVITRLKYFIDSNFFQIDYTNAVKILENCGKKFENPVYWGIDLASEHECYLSDQYFKGPVVVKNYPKETKAFYMRLNEDNKTVAAMDVLFPGKGEVIGGSQREERLEVLDIRMKEIGLKVDDYWWYRDLRRYGTVPHSGFGLGFERLVSYITGIQNIRDVIPFPRIPKNLEI